MVFGPKALKYESLEPKGKYLMATSVGFALESVLLETTMAPKTCLNPKPHALNPKPRDPNP